jgi:hypothetical protein
MAVTIHCKQPSSMVEVSIVAYCREEVQNLSVIGSRMTDAIGRENRQLQGARNPNGCLITPLFLALMVSLHFNVDIVSTKDSDQLLYGFTANFFAAID